VYGTRMLKKSGRKYSHDLNIGKKKKQNKGRRRITSIHFASFGLPAMMS
jgi:hypothetical protein